MGVTWLFYPRGGFNLLIAGLHHPGMERVHFGVQPSDGVVHLTGYTSHKACFQLGVSGLVQSVSATGTTDHA